MSIKKAWLKCSVNINYVVRIVIYEVEIGQCQVRPFKSDWFCEILPWLNELML